MRPITPQPGYVEADVINAMNSGQFVYADCYTITPLTGSPMLYTTAQRRVSVVPIGEVTRVNYEANVVLIKGLMVRNSIGLEVDQQSVELEYPPTNVSYQNYLSWPFALMSGRLDGAVIERDRFIGSDFNTWLGGFPMFRGLVSSMDRVGRSSAIVNVKSDLVLMDTQMPRNLYEVNCRNVWGDANCGVVQSTWAVIGAIGASPTRSVIPWSSASQHYDQGKLYIDNGDSVVRIRTIASVSGTNLNLSYPLDFDPYETQNFTVYPGCPRTVNATYGCPKYHGDPAWKTRYAGYPFVPVAETAF